MKTLASILVVGITFLSYSQQSFNQAKLIEFEDAAISTVNANYLMRVQDNSTPSEVANLQNIAAQFDIRRSKDFDSNVKNETFEVIFRNSKGSIVTLYTSSGKIESAYERFKNVKLPLSVQQQLHLANKDWSMIGNLFVSRYEGDDLIDRTYKIYLGKGDDKKKVVIHVPG